MSEAVAEIATEFIEAQPPVTAPAADPASTPAAVLEAPTPTPATPPGFNIKLHEADAAGNPILNKDGTLRRLRGRKPAKGPGGKFVSTKPNPSVCTTINLPPDSTPAAPPDMTMPAGIAEIVEDPVSPEDAKRAAALVVGMGISLACGWLDKEEWTPESPEEVAGIIDPLGECFVRYNVQLGPEWAAALAAVSYVGKRVRKPKTWERIAGLRAKIVSILFPWWK